MIAVTSVRSPSVPRGSARWSQRSPEPSLKGTSGRIEKEPACAREVLLKDGEISVARAHAHRTLQVLCAVGIQMLSENEHCMFSNCQLCPVCRLDQRGRDNSTEKTPSKTPAPPMLSTVVSPVLPSTWCALAGTASQSAARQPGVRHAIPGAARSTARYRCSPSQDALQKLAPSLLRPPFQ